MLHHVRKLDDNNRSVASSSLTFRYGQSFCMCPSGYKLGEDWKTCVDVDECATMASVREEECGGADRCVNTEGSYECVNATHVVDPGVEGGGHLCDDGYEYDYEGSVCVDVDECRGGAVDCGEGGECVNSEPGYECRCLDGYELDGEACRDVDECMEEQLCGHNGDCENVAGSYECRCHEGFQLDDGGRCADVDECADRCLENGRCVNSEGGFTCECDRGFKLDEDGENCVDVDECREVVERGGSRPCGRAR